MEREIKFNKGDLVRFVPRHRKYTQQELYHKGRVGEVIDFSDLPNVKMYDPLKPMTVWYGSDIVTADQRDLIQVGVAL